ncbi:alpha/beta fold hydrolase [Novosphingobium sp. FKTRR1]|uniref:alpha/beta hydrolase n=1 Tax=Novosphingobium sp. FKTRR1 TaxID=2879118 RepID=UPI001CF0B2EF|nr:alpha/beta hydrolase [Novosphingobium sp. FKTRR1]
MTVPLPLQAPQQAPQQAPLRRAVIDIGDPSGKGMAVIAAGDPARPVDVVFAHANGFNAHTYRLILSALGETLHVIAPDLRGHGLTALPADPDGRSDWRDHAADLRALVTRVATRPLVLAGHSLGGASAIIAAASGAPMLAGLVLFDPVMFSPALMARAGGEPSPMVEGAKRRRATFATRADAVAAYLGRGAFTTWPRAVVEDYVHDGFADDPDGSVRLTCAPAWEASNFQCAGGQDHWDELARVPCPVHAVRGTLGSMTTPPPVIPPDVVFEDWADASHFAPMEHGQRAVALLQAKVGEWLG